MVRVTLRAPGAGGEFGDQLPDDLPLLVAGVLRLVDQQMIDAEVELVVDPGRIDVGEKLQRLVDEIVVIEKPAARLLVVITRQHRMRDSQQRGGAVAADDGAPAIQQRADAALFRGQPLKEVWHP